MASKISLLFLFLLLATGFTAQSSDPSIQKQIDSLLRVKKQSNNDSLRLEVDFQVAELNFNIRLGFWDSLYQLSKKGNYKNLQSRILNNLGYVYNYKLEHEKAVNYYKEALKLAEQNDYKKEMLPPLFNLISAALGINNIREAIALSYKGIKTSEQINDTISLSGFYTTLANTYNVIGESRKAVNIHLVQLKIANRHAKICDLAELNYKISNDYEQLQDTVNCIRFAFKALSILNSKEDCLVTPGVFLGLGVAYRMRNMLDSATYYLENSKRLSQRLHLIHGEAAALSHLANIEHMRNKPDKVIANGLELIRLSKKYNNISYLLPSTSLLLKKAFLQKKDFANALKYYEMYVAATDSSIGEKNRKLAAQKEFDYNLEKKDNENKLLAQQNQIQTLQIQQNKYLVWGIAGFAILMVAMALLVLRQNRLKAQQQTSQLEQKLLRSQMNPHFIFNSLQAIQNFVLKNDTKAAVSYLSSFAAVTRNVLENSRMDSIPLKKEIALMQNYLHLQKLRFGNRFDFEIHFDEHVDPETINIPPMLAQPFIENAVEHGMHGLEKTGKIDVYYTLKDSFLLIEIIDNGSGMKTENVTGKQHQSMAIEITKERLALMNKKQKEKTFFKITDAFPNELQQKGVKVTFNISTRLLAN